MRYQIGHSWPGERGDRTIINILAHPSSGQRAYVVQSDDQPFPNLITEDRIDDEIIRDAKFRDQAIRRLQASEASRLESQEHEARQREHDRWYGFTDKMTPLRRGKASTILSKTMTLNDGAVEERGHVVYSLVSQGRHVDRGLDGVRYLISNDGRYLSEKTITKVGMDFAEFLLSGRAS
jgi:hypothetical protein